MERQRASSPVHLGYESEDSEDSGSTTPRARSPRSLGGPPPHSRPLRSYYGNLGPYYQDPTERLLQDVITPSPNNLGPLLEKLAKERAEHSEEGQENHTELGWELQPESWSEEHLEEQFEEHSEEAQTPPEDKLDEMATTTPARTGVSPSSSPRLPSPPPYTEVQIGPKSPTVGDVGIDFQLGDTTQPDEGASRRIRRGARAAEMASGPPVVDLDRLESPFQLQEHLMALHRQLTRSPDSDAHTVPIEKQTALQLAQPPKTNDTGEPVDKNLWLYELCRFLTKETNHLVVAFFADKPPCSPQTCPEMRASEWQYLCAVHDPPKSCAAIDYCCHTLDWAANILTNPKLFPSRLSLGGEGGSPANSMRQLVNIFRRVYRIYAHSWFQHREAFWQLENREGLYIFFKTVCDVYQLIPEDNYTIPPEAELSREEAEAIEDEKNETPIQTQNPQFTERVEILRRGRPDDNDNDTGTPPSMQFESTTLLSSVPTNISPSDIPLSSSETQVQTTTAAADTGDATTTTSSDTSSTTVISTGATTRRHKQTPSTGAHVSTIVEGAEEEEEEEEEEEDDDDEDEDKGGEEEQQLLLLHDDGRGDRSQVGETPADARAMAAVVEEGPGPEIATPTAEESDPFATVAVPTGEVKKEEEKGTTAEKREDDDDHDDDDDDEEIGDPIAVPEMK